MTPSRVMYVELISCRIVAYVSGTLPRAGDVVLNENDSSTGLPGATAEIPICDGVSPTKRFSDRLR